MHCPHGMVMHLMFDSIQKILGKAKRWHIVNSDFIVVDLLRDNDLGLLSRLVATVLITCFLQKQSIPIVWFFDLGAINLRSLHLNQNLQENHMSTTLCSCIYNYF